jgi:hypothetical protein
MSHRPFHERNIGVFDNIMKLNRWDPESYENPSTVMRLIIIGLSACLFLSPQTRGKGNWPCFRGASCGVAVDEVLPVSWSTTKNVVWKVDTIGRDWSCPVVWDNKMFLTTVASEGHVEEAKKGLYYGGERNKPSTAVHHWIVYCFDWDSGNTIWQETVHKGKLA